MTAVPNAGEPNWRQLHPRTIAMTVLTVGGILAGIAVPIVIGMLRNDRPVGIVLAIAAGGIVVLSGLAAVADLVRWRHTTYRVTDERVELRYAWVLHKLRSIPRERVRTVDLTANPLHRAFGLAKVKIGTGQQATDDNSHLTLDPVDKAEAEDLRRILLRRAAPAAPATSAASAGEPVAAAAGSPIASLDWSWLRYAPVSVTTPILGAAAFGGVMKVADWFGLESGVINTVGDWLRDPAIPVLVLVLVVIGLVIGVVGSVGLWVEMWYRYRLTREDGNLRVTRGLLTTRSLSLEQRRLRGVELFEPFGARLAKAARVDVVATGMAKKTENQNTDPKTLLPAAPMAVARRVASDVTGGPVDAVIVGHPKAARRRRLIWAGYWVVVPVAILVLLGVLLTTVLLHIAWITAVVLTPIAIALAIDEYRNLGHGLTGEHLVTRYGAGSRRTVFLLRSGVIGWRIRSSPFQRRAGLVTIGATTAANKGEYVVADVGESAGLALADEAVPGLLTPFLEPRP